jgi:hypothetical protein
VSVRRLASNSGARNGANIPSWPRSRLPELYSGFPTIVTGDNMAAQPAAFMTYVRSDDQREGGQLTLLRERLAAEIRSQTHEEFAIFQDRNDIAWGQNWEQRIDEALDAATILLVIVTPSLFRSSASRTEIVRFLEREQKLGRDDLIVPIYYVSTPELDDPVRRQSDDSRSGSPGPTAHRGSD